MIKETYTFALDIGTRSVVGLLLSEKDGAYEVIDTVIQEHGERSMLDGQIHDVISVSNVISSVKEKLEEKHGTLQEVCVAAAGRALKTIRAEAHIDIEGKPIIQTETVFHLELMAVQEAQKQLALKEKAMQEYDCVGYSVIHYNLDHQEIGSLVDQQGKIASAEIIATFLPKVVVESLHAALSRANLEMKALTLEPIAAINVLIPPSMRRLNVALVDIGAGTSDIAITNEGTVTAYGMVPIAGDEITEAISDQFLLDFHDAEQAKRELNTSESILVKDILGFENEILKEDAIAQIHDSIDKLASAIKEEIYSLNKEASPKAVMLIGGGSLTPKLPEMIAEKLNLPLNRVAIRGIDAIKQLKFAGHLKKGPELVTPIGIAISSNQNPIQYVSVKVNERSVRLLHMRKLTVSDSFLSSGIQMSKYYGKPGLAFIASLNGQSITIPGTYGEAPLLFKNGKVCSVEDEIHNGDEIIIEKGKDGRSLSVALSDLIDAVPATHILLNGERIQVEAKLALNGKPASLTDLVADRDSITYSFPDQIKDILPGGASFAPFHLVVDGSRVQLDAFSGKILINHVPALPSSPFEEWDQITAVPTESPSISQVLSELKIAAYDSLQVLYNKEPLTIKKMTAEVYRDEKLLSLGDKIHNGDRLTIKKQPPSSFIFQDVFTAVDIKIPTEGSRKFLLLKNEKETAFHEELLPGDKLSIKWI
ncbi:pilus assembly protein PilM [Peribacillus frigoritolerans]|uniref:pilus assembly protein PilM n=1 Tax=Peribacillus frigoritolerans TaxID=450367 RepID=UPI0010598C2F|nr:pilus assembly protein PilM [Peribacillus frigoritolerans]TDL76467.1 cell division protein [Peribacillus frigoritolerans]